MEFTVSCPLLLYAFEMFCKEGIYKKRASSLFTGRNRGVLQLLN